MLLLEMKTQGRMRTKRRMEAVAAMEEKRRMEAVAAMEEMIILVVVLSTSVLTAL
jgi:hypothetical protein